MASMAAVGAEVERHFRSESGAAVATLVRSFGDIDVAEVAVQEAFAVALNRWAESGVPPNPAGWIITTAATAPSTTFGVKPPSTIDMRRPPCCARAISRQNRSGQ